MDSLETEPFISAIRKLPPSICRNKLQIKEAIQEGAERKAYLEVDARCPYGDLGIVLDQVRSTGIQQVAFLEEMN